MTYYLEPQLKNAKEIKDILKKVPISFELSDGRDINTLLVYLPNEDGESCYLEFFEKIKEGILANFVFSCSEVEKKLGIKSTNSAEELFDKAIRKLSKHTAQGELGELILFILLDVYFNAPKILSKISLKTSRRMPVFGADAVHGQFYDGKFKLYLGESKLHKDCASASTKAATSIKNAKAKFGDEFDLLDSYMDFPNIDEKLESELLDLLNPFINNDYSEVLHSPCFIGFADPELISNSQSEKEFIENYSELACNYIEDFFKKVEKQELTIEEVSFLMLPFSCTDQLVKEFIEYMGIEE